MSFIVVCRWVAVRPRVVRRAVVAAVVNRPRVVRRMILVCTVVPLNLTPGIFPSPADPRPPAPTVHERLEAVAFPSEQARLEILRAGPAPVPAPGLASFGLGAIFFVYAVWRGKRK